MRIHCTIVAGGVAAAALFLAAASSAQEVTPEKALTWAECRERYLEIANEGQPSAAEAENGWPLIVSLAAEALDAEAKGLPLDEAWFGRAAGIVEYERFVRDVSETPRALGDDLIGLGRDARWVGRYLFERLWQAIERDDTDQAAALFEQLLTLTRAAFLQPSVVTLLAANVNDPAQAELAARIAHGEVSGAMAAALLRVINESQPMPPASRNYRGEGWLSAQYYFSAPMTANASIKDALVVFKFVRDTGAINELFARAADLPRNERAAAGLGSDTIAAVAKSLLGAFDWDDGIVNVGFRTLGIADAGKATRAGVHTLLAIEAYRDQHGVPPETLDALVPDYLASLPVDPFAPDGRFVYRLVDQHGRSYLLYSVGIDGVDNGGTPAAGGLRRAFVGEELNTDAVFNQPSAE